MTRLEEADVAVLDEHAMAVVDQRQATQQATWRLASQGQRTVDFLGARLRLAPGVFPPRADTELLARHLPGVNGARVADVGTGSGALAIHAARHGAASVLALDVSTAAVDAARVNVHGLGLTGTVELRVSNALEAVADEERFGLIIANLPGRNRPAPDAVAATQWDAGFAAHRAVFARARHHLLPGGSLWMVKANYPDLLEMGELAEAAGWSVFVRATSTPDEAEPRTYRVLELVPRP